MEPIELNPRDRAEALGSLRRYAEENLPKPLGEMAASLLLDYMLEEVAPLVYNRAIADAQARLTLRLDDLAGELHRNEFGYWPRVDARRKRR